MTRSSFDFSKTLMQRAAIVGHTTAYETNIWIRTKRTGDFELLLSASPMTAAGMANPLRVIAFTTTAADDQIKVLHVDGLLAAKRYNYAVRDKLSGAWELGSKDKFSFETMSDASSHKLSFATYSCHMPFRSKQQSELGMWPLFKQLLDNHHCSFAIASGDQVYVDGKPFINIWRHLQRLIKDDGSSDISADEMLEWYREVYRAHWGFPEVRRVHATIPQYMVADDHEFKDGWGSFNKDKMARELAGAQSVNAAVVASKRTFIDMMEKAAHKAYHEYQHSHNPKTGHAEYDYSMRHCGNDFFALDMRSCKNYDANIMLGDDQQARLEQWLDSLKNNHSSAAPFFIISPVPMVHLKDWLHNEDDLLTMLASQFGAKDDFRDHWEYEKNRVHLEAIMDMVFACSEATGRPAVFLSGDVHVAAAYALSSPAHAQARVFQVTSSPISYPTSKLSKNIAKKGSGPILNTPYSFERLSDICTDHNIALIRTETEGDQASAIHVQIVTKDKKGRPVIFWDENLL